MTRERPKVSIFVITWNRFKLTFNCLEALIYLTRTLDKEIIVVDNGSEDETPIYLKQLKKDKKIDKHYLFPRNMGCGIATNKGMQLSKGDFIIEVDNDIMLLEGAIEKGLELMNKQKQIGQIGFLPNPFPESKIEYGIDTGAPNVAGAWMIRRKFYDEGIRWCEKSWKEVPWQAKLFSDEIAKKGYVVGNLIGETYAIDLAKNNHQLYEDYYRKTYKDRNIEPLLDEQLKLEKLNNK